LAGRKNEATDKKNRAIPEDCPDDHEGIKQAVDTGAKLGD